MIKSNKIFRQKFYGLNLGNSQNFARRIIALIIVVAFLSNSLAFGALDGSLPTSSPLFNISFRSLSLNQDSLDNYFNLGLNLPRNVSFGKKELRQKAKDQIDYFLTCLTNPLDDFWVNLNPNQKDRVIGKKIDQTVLGKNLLDLDLLLKKRTAYQLHPLYAKNGSLYWDLVFKKARELQNSVKVSEYQGVKENTKINIPTQARVWIIPDKAQVYESPDGKSVYIVKATLKVLLESEYQKNSVKVSEYQGVKENNQQLQDYAERLMKELIVPDLTNQVNNSKEFKQLRDIYQALILATWYKEKVSKCQGVKVSEADNYFTNFIDKSNLKQLNKIKPNYKYKLFDKYLASVTKGEFRYSQIKYSSKLKKDTKRNYISGGVEMKGLSGVIETVTLTDAQQAGIKPSQQSDVNSMSLGDNELNWAVSSQEPTKTFYDAGPLILAGIGTAIVLGVPSLALLVGAGFLARWIWRNRKNQNAKPLSTPKPSRNQIRRRNLVIAGLTSFSIHAGLLLAGFLLMGNPKTDNKPLEIQQIMSVDLIDPNSLENNQAEQTFLDQIEVEQTSREQDAQRDSTRQSQGHSPRLLSPGERLTQPPQPIIIIPGGRFPDGAPVMPDNASVRAIDLLRQMPQEMRILPIPIEEITVVGGVAVGRRIVSDDSAEPGLGVSQLDDRNIPEGDNFSVQQLDQRPIFHILFRNLSNQGESLDRAIVFTESREHKGQVLTDETLSGLLSDYDNLGDNDFGVRRNRAAGYNFTNEQLAQFFNQAKDKGIQLNAQEQALLAELIRQGIIEEVDGHYQAGSRVSVISSAKGTGRSRDVNFHELGHSLYETDPEYRAEVDAVWQGLSSEERQIFKDILGYLNYDQSVFVTEFAEHSVDLVLFREILSRIHNDARVFSPGDTVSRGQQVSAAQAYDKITEQRLYKDDKHPTGVYLQKDFQRILRNVSSKLKEAKRGAFRRSGLNSEGSLGDNSGILDLPIHIYQGPGILRSVITIASESFEGNYESIVEKISKSKLPPNARQDAINQLDRLITDKGYSRKDTFRVLIDKDKIKEVEFLRKQGELSLQQTVDQSLGSVNSNNINEYIQSIDQAIGGGSWSEHDDLKLTRKVNLGGEDFNLNIRIFMTGSSVGSGPMVYSYEVIISVDEPDMPFSFDLDISGSGKDKDLSVAFNAARKNFSSNAREKGIILTPQDNFKQLTLDEGISIIQQVVKSKADNYFLEVHKRVFIDGKKYYLHLIQKNSNSVFYGGFETRLGIEEAIVKDDKIEFRVVNRLGVVSHGDSRTESLGKAVEALQKIQQERGLPQLGNSTQDAHHFQATKLKGKRNAVNADNEKAKRVNTVTLADINVGNVSFQMTEAERNDLCGILGVSQAELGALITRAFNALAMYDIDTARLTPKILIALLGEQDSEHLFEDCQRNSFIGINRELAQIARTNPILARILFITGLAHELRHEAGIEGEDNQLDARFIITLIRVYNIALEEFLSVYDEHFDNTISDVVELKEEIVRQGHSVSMFTRQGRLGDSQAAIKDLSRELSGPVTIYDIGIGWDPDFGPITTKELADTIPGVQVIGIDNQMPAYIIKTSSGVTLLFDDKDNLIGSYRERTMTTAVVMSWKQREEFKALGVSLKQTARGISGVYEGHHISFNPIATHTKPNLSYVTANLLEETFLIGQGCPKANIVRIANVLIPHYKPQDVVVALRNLLPYVEENGYVLISFSEKFGGAHEECLVYQKINGKFIFKGYLFSSCPNMGLEHGIYFGYNYDFESSNSNVRSTQQRLKGLLIEAQKGLDAWDKDYRIKMASSLAQLMSQSGIDAVAFGSMVFVDYQDPQESGLSQDALNFMKALKSSYLDLGFPSVVSAVSSVPNASDHSPGVLTRGEGPVSSEVAGPAPSVLISIKHKYSVRQLEEILERGKSLSFRSDIINELHDKLKDNPRLYKKIINQFIEGESLESALNDLPLSRTPDMELLVLQDFLRNRNNRLIATICDIFNNAYDAILDADAAQEDTIELKIDISEEEVRIEVSDTGVGIKEDELRILFLQKINSYKEVDWGKYLGRLGQGIRNLACIPLCVSEIDTMTKDRKSQGLGSQLIRHSTSDSYKHRESETTNRIYDGQRTGVGTTVKIEIQLTGEKPSGISTAVSAPSVSNHAMGVLTRGIQSAIVGVSTVLVSLAMALGLPGISHASNLGAGSLEPTAILSNDLPLAALGFFSELLDMPPETAIFMVFILPFLLMVKATIKSHEEQKILSIMQQVREDTPGLCLPKSEELARRLNEAGIQAVLYTVDDRLLGKKYKGLTHFFVRTRDFVLDIYPEGLGRFKQDVDQYIDNDVVMLGWSDAKATSIYGKGVIASSTEYEPVTRNGKPDAETQRLLDRLEKRKAERGKKPPKALEASLVVGGVLLVAAALGTAGLIVAGVGLAIWWFYVLKKKIQPAKSASTKTDSKDRLPLEETVLLDALVDSFKDELARNPDEASIEQAVDNLGVYIKRELREQNVTLVGVNYLLPEIDKLLVARGYTIGSSPMWLLDEHIFVLYKVQYENTINTLQGPVRVLYVSQATKFRSNIPRGEIAWSLQDVDYVVVFLDHILYQNRELYEPILQGKDALKGLFDDSYSDNLSLAEIYCGLIRKGLSNIASNSDELIRLQLDSARDHEVEHEARDRILRNYNVRFDNKDLQEEIAFLSELSQAGEPWHRLAHVFLLTTQLAYAWNILGRLVNPANPEQNPNEIIKWLEGQLANGTTEGLRQTAQQAYNQVEIDWCNYFDVPLIHTIEPIAAVSVVSMKTREFLEQAQRAGETLVPSGEKINFQGKEIDLFVGTNIDELRAALDQARSDTARTEGLSATDPTTAANIRLALGMLGVEGVSVYSKQDGTQRLGIVDPNAKDPVGGIDLSKLSLQYAAK